MLTRIHTGGLSVNTYIVTDPKTKKAAVIDVTRDIQATLKKITEEQIDVIAILETHVHSDFISGSKELKHRLPTKPSIYCSGLGNQEWIPRYADVIVSNHLKISLGALTLEACHTPGHTLEHLLWTVSESSYPKQGLTGDFLFVNSIGRPDLLGIGYQQQLSEMLYTSVFEILPHFDDSMEVHPAHGAGSFCGKKIGHSPSSTLLKERQNNPFLKPKSKNEWIQLLMKDMPPIPSYFSRVKEMNVSGPPFLEELPIPQALSPENVKDNLSNFSTIVDIRSQEKFAALHLQDSINIPFGSIFINWASVVITDQGSLLLVTEDVMEVEQAITALRLVGLDNKCFYFLIENDSLKSTNIPLKTLPILSPQELLSKIINDPENVLVIDVRTNAEWFLGHIKGARHIALDKLGEQIENIPPHKSLAVICGSGYRSSIGASLLSKKGFTNVFNVQGGMQEWKKEGLPLNLTL